MLIKQIRYNNFLALLILLQSVTIFSASFNNLYLYIVLPFLAIIALSYKKYDIFLKDRLFKIYSIFILIYLINTFFFSIDLQSSLSLLKTFIGYYLVAFIIDAYSSNYRYLKVFLWFYFLYYIFIWFLGVFDYGFLNIDYSFDRAGGEGLNANRFGYFTFFITFIVYILGELSHKRKNILLFKYLFLLMPLISFFTAILTGSRQVLIIQIPFITILIMLRYFSKINTRTIFFVFLFFLTFAFIYDNIIGIYNNSFLSRRMDKDIVEDTRYYLLLLGFEIGFDNFFTGVGLNNYKLFSNGMISHSSFSEAFSEAGIFALIAYVYLLYIFTKMQLQRYFSTKNKMFLSFVWFGVFYFVFNFFYVFYEFGLLIAFIFLVENLSQHIYNKQIQLSLEDIQLIQDKD